MSKGIPQHVDRLIVHQFDPSRPSPGGIDTCLRGIARYASPGATLAFVGVDTGSGPVDRKIGKWELHTFGERQFWFLPVVRLDPADQRRRVPHSLRLAIGVLRSWRKLPKATFVQSHRMDIGTVTRLLFKSRQAYFIHTQDHGLTGKTSDSMWRLFGKLHRNLERETVKGADQVVVFNPDYAETVKEWNSNAVFSPTWFDPNLVLAGNQRDPHKICWVGRLEVPKDPILAVRAFRELVQLSPQKSWTLEMLGSGTLFEAVQAELSAFPSDIASRVSVHGRVEPKRVAAIMANSGQFLMTSHPGYEGYPRVLVEALASGLPCVVTEGSDTGSLIHDNVNGFVTSRSPMEIAERMLDAQQCDRGQIASSVANLSAPNVIDRIYSEAA